MDPDPAFYFDTDPDPGFQFYTDLDPYRFKEVMYLKRYFLYIFNWFYLSVGPTGPTQTVFFVKFSLPVNFVVLIRVAYGSGSNTPGERIRILKNYTDPYESESATLVSCCLYKFDKNKRCRLWSLPRYIILSNFFWNILHCEGLCRDFL